MLKVYTVGHPYLNYERQCIYIQYNLFVSESDTNSYYFLAGPTFKQHWKNVLARTHFHRSFRTVTCQSN